MSLLGRPVGQDTISHPSSLQELPLKLEDSQGNGSLLREDSDHEGDQDESDGDGDDEEHSDPDQPEQGHPRQSRRIAKREANNDDADMSLSSDNDDDEESASMHNNDEEYSNMPEETICRWKDCGKILPSLAELVMHLSDEHIGWKKTSYTCEWQGMVTTALFHLEGQAFYHIRLRRALFLHFGVGHQDVQGGQLLRQHDLL